MGTRTWSYYNCPECGKKDGVEIYDHPSASMYVEKCKKCGYLVDLDYYDESEHALLLINKEQAKEKGYLCKKCDSKLWIEERERGYCDECTWN